MSWFDQTWFGRGIKAASTTGEATDLMSENFSNVNIDVIRDFIRATVNKYQWIFVGAFPPTLQDLVQQGKVEFYPWQTLLDYPKFIASLNAQLMVAPLQVNDFNRAKSDIKFIEACVLGIPCLCQDMDTYNNAPQALKFNTGEEFEYKIRSILDHKNRNNYFNNIKRLRQIG